MKAPTFNRRATRFPPVGALLLAILLLLLQELWRLL